MLKRILLCVLILIAGTIQVLAQSASEIEFQGKLEIDISNTRNNQFKAEIKTHGRINYTRALAKSVDAFSIYVPPFANFQSVKGEANGKTISSDFIKKYKADDEYVFLADGEKIIVENPITTFSDKNSFAYTLEYTISDSAYIPAIKVPYRYSIDKYMLTVKHPSDFKVRFKIVQLTDSLTFSIDSTEERRTTLLVKCKKGTTKAGYPFNDVAAWILPEITKNSKPVNVFTPASFFKWYQSKLNNYANSKEELNLIANSIIQSKEDSADKFQAIYSYSKDKVRYIFDGTDGHSHFPHKPNYIFGKGYGDCKDKSWFVKSLSELFGLPVYMALVSTEPVPEFSTIYLNRFNHVIVAVLTDSGYVFGDPTARTFSFGTLPPILHYKQAFVLNPEEPSLVTITNTGSQNFLDYSLKAKVNSLNQAIGQIVAGKQTQDYLNQIMEVKQFKQNPDGLKFYFNNPFNRLEILSANLNTDNVPDSFTVQADLKAIVLNTPKRLYVAKSVYDYFDPKLADRELDSQPIFLGSKPSISLLLYVSAEESLVDGIEMITIDNKYFLFTSTIISKGKDIFVKQLFTPRHLRVSTDEKVEFISELKKYFEYQNKMFVINKENNP